VVCSLGSNATSRAPDDATTGTDDLAGPDADITMATSGVGVAMSRCELTEPISNASFTSIKLVFDVVDIEHVR